MKHLVLFLIGIFSLLTANAQANRIQKENWHWGNPAGQDTQAGYSQVLKVANVLYLSGAVSDEITPEGVARVYKGLLACLESYGAGFQNAVRENLYTTNMEAMKQNNDTRKQFYQGDYPAATWVAVKRLYTESAKLEIELIAHLPGK